jgi:putative transcriptional regulator
VTEEDADLHALAESVFSSGAAAPVPRVRDHVLALAEAPRGEVNVADYAWTEIAPGIRAFETRNDARVRACLIWADAGAVHPRHRHLGDEDILILKGTLRDERGVYGPGEICHSRRGEIHSESITADEDCICFAVYYDGGIEPA